MTDQLKVYVVSLNEQAINICGSHDTALKHVARQQGIYGGEWTRDSRNSNLWERSEPSPLRLTIQSCLVDP